MLLFATTGFGDAVLVVDKSAAPETVVVAVPVSLPGFGSVVADETVALFEITVPEATEAPTFATSVNTELPTANEPLLQLIAPTLPTPGLVQLQPLGEMSETNVVPAGKVSVINAEAATLGPALVTVIV